MKILSKQLIFKAGEEGYAFYRIPVAVCAKNGDILLFCEGRLKDCGDSGRIDIVMKRSRDGGKTWENLEVVFSDGINTTGNPCPVVDAETGKICVVFCRNLAEDHEWEIIAGDKKPRTVWCSFSPDNGESWSEPVDISDQTRRPDWTWYATGPCHGLQASTGKFIIPCNHGELGIEKTRSHIIYSDDRGESWNIGPSSGPATNESTAAQLGSRICWNMRNHIFEGYRAYCFSDDFGVTFSEPACDKALPEPVCQGSMLEYKGKLLFSNPASTTARELLTLKYGTPENWNEQILIESGPSAYSDIVASKADEIVVIHEAAIHTLYDCIWATTVKI